MNNCVWSLILLLTTIGVIFSAKYQFIYVDRLGAREAEYCCRQLGMSLLKINNMEEHDDVTKYLEDYRVAARDNMSSFWFGLEYAASSFKWTDGAGLNSSIDCWGAGEPTNLHKQTCVYQAFGKGRPPCEWHTAPCDTGKKYICEESQYLDAEPLADRATAHELCQRYTISTGGSRTSSPSGAGQMFFGVTDGNLGLDGMIQVVVKQLPCIEDCAAICLRNNNCKRYTYVEGNEWDGCKLYG